MLQTDLQTMYVMVVMLTAISGHTMMGYQLPVITHAFWFASPENEWRQLFGHHILDWIAVCLMILSGIGMWILAALYFLNTNPQ